MQRALFASAAIALFAIPAAAADLPISRTYAPAASGWRWTGFYVGFHGGFGGDQFKYPFSAPGIPISGDASLTSSGFFGGGQIGYNYHFHPNWLVGIEADIAGSGIKGELALSAPGLSLKAGTELDWFGTVRGRAGYVWDRSLFYVTGGYAYGRTTSSVDFGVGGGGIPAVIYMASERVTKSGWTVGGGIEYALLPNLSLKTEYLYLDLGRDNLINVPGTFRLDEETRVHTVKAGLNWRFGSGFR